MVNLLPGYNYNIFIIYHKKRKNVKNSTDLKCQLYERVVHIGSWNEGKI